MADIWTKLSNVDVAPPYRPWLVLFSPDGQLVLGNTSAPYLSLYKRTGDVFNKLPDPANLPTDGTNAIAISPDGTHLVTGGNSAITVYRRDGDTLTKLTTSILNYRVAGYGLAFSHNGQFLAISYSVSPYLAIYERTGDTYTKLTNPVNIPTTGATLSWSLDDQYLATSYGGTTPWIYQRNGTTFTKLNSPLTLPAAAGQVVFSPDGQHFIARGSSQVFIYKYNAGTYTSIQTLAHITDQVTYSPDSMYLAMPSDGSPWEYVYKRNGDAYTLLPEFATHPSNCCCNGVAFSPDGVYLAFITDADPLVPIYKSDNPPYSPTTTKTFTVTNYADDGVIGVGGIFTNFGYSYFSDSCYFKFNVSIPKGATINNAFLEFYSHSTDSVTRTVTFTGIDQDNSVVPSDPTEFNSRPRTALVTVTVPICSTDTYYSTTDLSSIVQAIIDRPGWVSGNAIMFNNSKDSNVTRGFYTKDSGYPPKLTITYTEAVPSPVTITTPTVTASIDFNLPTVTSELYSGYVLERHTGDGNWTEIARITSGNSYDDTDVVDGVTYYGRIKKVVNGVESPYSNITTTTVISSAVINAQIATAVITSVVPIPTTIFTEPTDGIILQRHNGDGNWVNVASLPLTAVEWIDNNTTVGNTYYYRTKKNDGFSISHWSDPQVITITSIPSMIINIIQQGPRLQLSWVV